MIEDSEGDLWFATNNGISIYFPETGKWKYVLTDYDTRSNSKNHIFTTLCEVKPGLVLAGGLTPLIYSIDKKSMRVSYAISSQYENLNMHPEKYIQSIIKDSNGYIWSGGYYNLTKIDLKNKKTRHYPGINSINIILEKDTDYLWIGCSNGLYILNKSNGVFREIKMPKRVYICTLHQEKNGMLYIGTYGSGMLVYNIKTNKFSNYDKENGALISKQHLYHFIR